jgi:copper(I)-binding protein
MHADFVAQTTTMGKFIMKNLMRNSMMKNFLLILAMLFASQIAYADANISIQNAWVRASTPGKKIGAAYMTIKSSGNVEMVYAETTRAGSVEMHSMTMNNGVMKMRMLESLPVKANQPVSLAPGGLHLMLFDLNAPLKAGEKITFRLCFKNSAGKILEQTITAPVKENP